MKLESIAGRRKSVSENCQSVEGAREERTSSPQPSPPPAYALLRRGKEERERISQTRSKQERKLNDLKLKSVSHPLLAASIMACAAVNLATAEDNPPAAKPAQTKSQLTAPDVQPGLQN